MLILGCLVANAASTSTIHQPLAMTQRGTGVIVIGKHGIIRRRIVADISR
jgi:hypothetical protein